MASLRKIALIGVGAVAGLGAAAFGAVYFIPAVQDAIVERVVTGTLGETREALFADDALRAVVCGSSSPLPDPNRAKACIMVIAGGKYWLVDTGPESWRNISLWRIPADRIGGVLLTHFHSDHIGELGEVNMNTWGLGRPAPLKVYGPPGVERVVNGFMEAYALDQGYRTAHHTAELLPPDIWRMEPVTVDFPMPPTPAHDRGVVMYDDGELKITAFEVNHAPIDPAYGYRFDYKGRSIAVGGDTVLHHPMAKWAQGVDVLFHEAQQQEIVTKMSEVAGAKGSSRLQHILHDIGDYHSSPVDAATIANEAGAKLLVLYHYTPPLQNFIVRRIYERGVSDVRPDGVEFSHDGTLIELPFGSTDVRVGDIRD